MQFGRNWHVADLSAPCPSLRAKRTSPNGCWMSGSDPSVWTGRVLQVGCERWRGLVLRFCIRPVSRALVLLAIMDIRAHPISFCERPREASWVTRSRMRRRDRFSISSIQLADLGSPVERYRSLKALDLTLPLLRRALRSCAAAPTRSKRCAPACWRAQLPEHCSAAVLPRP